MKTYRSFASFPFSSPFSSRFTFIFPSKHIFRMLRLSNSTIFVYLHIQTNVGQWCDSGFHKAFASFHSAYQHIWKTTGLNSFKLHHSVHFHAWRPNLFQDFYTDVTGWPEFQEDVVSFCCWRLCLGCGPSMFIIGESWWLPSYAWKV